MAYLSKQSIINAINCIKKTESHVHASSFSAIQYFVALDRFYYQKENEIKKEILDSTDVDTSDISVNKLEKKRYISFIADIISLDDGCYFKTFKELYSGNKKLEGTVGSNFFAGSSVDVSLKVSDKCVDYPQQDKPLLYALNGNVYTNKEYYSNLNEYLPTVESRFALAIWLLRKDDLLSLSLDEFRNKLGQKYTKEFLDILLPLEVPVFEEVLQFFNLELAEQMAMICKNDIVGEDGEVNKLLSYFSRQIIYYGAPGTGKSSRIKKLTKEAESDERVFRTTFHPDSDYSTFVGAYKPKMNKGKIIYTFEPQAFTSAYIKAWNTDKPVFLIVEEINRGNCAQIFGDIFQLLDRENDESEYNIKADSSLADYLKDNLKDSARIPGLVRKGIEMKLPSNLYIWATMNTSDQSLFPIDSAFKRRWDWEYIKIAKGKDKETKEDLKWAVDFEYEENKEKYRCHFDWWDFVQTINNIIASATSSDDKKLGYFFCKAKENEEGNDIIDEKTFVGKVVFYLWNDVLKEEKPEKFKVYSTCGEPSFDAFYKEDEDGETVVDTLALRDFVKNIFDDEFDNKVTIEKIGQEVVSESETTTEDLVLTSE